MRYNPATDQAISIEEIAEQGRNGIQMAQHRAAQAQVRDGHAFRMGMLYACRLITQAAPALELSADAFSIHSKCWRSVWDAATELQTNA